MDIVSYSLKLRDLHIKTYRYLRGLIPLPGRPARLTIATSDKEYRGVSKGSRILEGAAAFMVPGRNQIVLNAPRMMSLHGEGTYFNCCTITHEYIHIAMENTDESLVRDSFRLCRRRRDEICDVVGAQGWSTRRSEELVTICCEWVYCPHFRSEEDCGMMDEIGGTFIDLLGWLRPDVGD